MATVIRRGRFGWKSPWVLVGVASLLLGAVGGGVALGVGLAGRGSGGSPPIATATPTVTHEPSPSPSPSPAVTPSPSPPASVLAQLHGRIAISSGQPGTGGWITLPGGRFSADASSMVTLGGGAWFGLTHVLALNRWVAVPRDWVSPDGTKYSYFYEGAIHVVRAGASDLVLTPPSVGAAGMSWDVLWTSNTGVYVVPSARFMPGVWFVSYTGQVQAIATVGYWTVSDGKVAYGSMATSVPQGAENTIARLSLTTGLITDVFSQLGMESTVAGVASDGSAVVVALKRNPMATYPSTFQIWIASATPVLIYEIKTFADVPQASVPSAFAVQSVVADSMGTWITISGRTSSGSPVSGVYLYSAQSGFEQAASVTGVLGSVLRK